MIRARILPMSIAWVVISTPLISAQDLSRYREFQLGMSLVAVAQQVGITPEGRVLHQRPGLIQELMWLPHWALHGKETRRGKSSQWLQRRALPNRGQL
jgi:hypothetical protein